MNHVREKLPDMKARLNTLMGQTQQELNALGDISFLGGQHQVLLLTSRIVRKVLTLLAGRIDSSSYDSLRA